MRATFIFLILLFECNLFAQDVELIGNYWIPEVIDWKNNNSSSKDVKSQFANFETIYFKNDTVFYILSSYQCIDLTSDSLAYGIEPGYNVFKGSYKVDKERLYIEYIQIHGSFFLDEVLRKDTIFLKSKTFIFNEEKYKKTSYYTKYSKGLINSHILISEEKK